MRLIVGLGNPTEKYKKTRHNTGFMVADFLAENMDLAKFKMQSKFKSEIAEGKMGNQKIIMAKPMTYMNNSGEAVQALQTFYKIKTENIIVVYDELDLSFGEIRIRKEGSSAGHRGVGSIIEKLGTDKFTRVRIGIRNEKNEKIPADKFVLSRFSILERLKLKKDILPRVLEEARKMV